MVSRQHLEFTGSYFEVLLARHLKQVYPEVQVLYDVKVWSAYLQKETQIDLLLVHSMGVFAIEAKNWKGWIKGEYSDEHWTGKSLSRKVLRVFNPTNQNFIHVRALKNAIRGLGEVPPMIHSLVCFPDGADICSSCSELCNFSSLSSKINTILQASTEKIHIEAFCDLVSKCGNI